MITNPKVSFVDGEATIQFQNFDSITGRLHWLIIFTNLELDWSLICGFITMPTGTKRGFLLVTDVAESKAARISKLSDSFIGVNDQHGNILQTAEQKCHLFAIL